MAKFFTCECGFRGRVSAFDPTRDPEFGDLFLTCPECGKESFYDEGEEGDERFLRMQEEWGAYQACGCTEGFWEDLADGYI